METSSGVWKYRPSSSSVSFYYYFPVDDFYQRLEANVKGKGPGSGRGRPPSLPVPDSGRLTNRLLLQLGYLRHKLETTWKVMEDAVQAMLQHEEKGAGEGEGSGNHCQNPSSQGPDPSEGDRQRQTGPRRRQQNRHSR